MKKEFREFFLRATAVLSGSKRDQEVPYPTTTTVNGQSKGNRFLDGHYPTNGVFAKLFESITFKLNSEDAATSSQQGLVRLANDTQADGYDSSLDSKGFVPVVQPHQITKHYGSAAGLTETINGKTVKVLYDGGIVLSNTDSNVDTSEFAPGSYATVFNTVFGFSGLPTNGSRIKFKFRIKVANGTDTSNQFRMLFITSTVSNNVFEKTADGTANDNTYVIEGEIIRIDSTNIRIVYQGIFYQLGALVSGFEGILDTTTGDLATNTVELRLQFNGAAVPNWTLSQYELVRFVK